MRALSVVDLKPGIAFARSLVLLYPRARTTTGNAGVSCTSKVELLDRTASRSIRLSKVDVMRKTALRLASVANEHLSSLLSPVGIVPAEWFPIRV